MSGKRRKSKSPCAIFGNGPFYITHQVAVSWRVVPTTLTDDNGDRLKRSVDSSRTRDVCGVL